MIRFIRFKRAESSRIQRYTARMVRLESSGTCRSIFRHVAFLVRLPHPFSFSLSLLFVLPPLPPPPSSSSCSSSCTSSLAQLPQLNIGIDFHGSARLVAALPPPSPPTAEVPDKTVGSKVAVCTYMYFSRYVHGARMTMDEEEEEGGKLEEVNFRDSVPQAR